MGDAARAQGACPGLKRDEDFGTYDVNANNATVQGVPFSPKPFVPPAADAIADLESRKAEVHKEIGLTGEKVKQRKAEWKKNSRKIAKEAKDKSDATDRKFSKGPRSFVA